MVTFIDEQITHSLESGARQRRWSPEFIQFCLSLRHQSSGRAVIEFLAGAGNFGKKRNNNSNTNFNLHIPSNRTLDTYEKPGYYPIPHKDEIQELIQRATTYADQVASPLFIFSFDGVFAIPTYEYDIHDKTVLGGEKALTSEEFVTASDEKLQLNHGKEIVQFFMQHIDGGYVEPIGHFVLPHGKPSTWIIDRLKELVAIYSSSCTYFILFVFSYF